ncbi:Phosphatidate cytidylyltransferase [Rubrivivax sp. A210]|uniref:phosphatidate cytidylyltransferase n=1 Tax=Rubrivivax sp. A210 TaxID=2772301 RepID=UPI001919451F|nr:phosphatidate cytidylyltransferase [Rubrivivax sp. A210]CAD5367290.1 Phosphatidate cytidylyltransferase [Rubrivivax sp. A210]
MLRQRIVTALVLVALLLAALSAASPWPFALLMLALIAAGGWEWGRLNQAPAALALAMGAAVAAVGLALLVVLGGVLKVSPAVWWGALVLWVVAGSLALKSGPAAWPQMPRAARWGLGLAALVATWLAVTQARAIGINFLLSVLCLVWMADVAAYFGGRAFGRRKLAPSISPGKSWEGVWSGMAGVALLAMFWIWLDGRSSFDSASLYTRLYGALGPVGLALALPALCGLSVMGDLIESLVKRAAGAKDSSSLLPGHGGVLDRVDALLPVLPVALALASLGGH